MLLILRILTLIVVFILAILLPSAKISTTKKIITYIFISIVIANCVFESVIIRAISFFAGIIFLIMSCKDVKNYSKNEKHK